MSRLLDKTEQLMRIQALDSVNRNLNGNLTICSNCGKSFKMGEGAFCKKIFCLRKNLCPQCMKFCKKCGKYFCPKHIDNHKCK